jgi:predicted N-acyltransferase
MLPCCKNTQNFLFYSSVSEISETVWKQLDCTQHVYFHPNYLTSLEKNNPHIHFLYIVLIDEFEKPISFASIQIIDFLLDSIRNDLEQIVRNIKNIGRKLHVFPKKKPLKILICGNTFVSGEHGIFIKNNQDKNKVIKQLTKAILHVVNSDAKLKKSINIFLLKDFVNESLFITDTVKEANYYSFNAEPNMVLNMHSSWKTFDDYLAAVKTKFRVKAKKALKQSADLNIIEVNLDNIKNQLPAMTSLYKKVASKADFNLGDFNLETYITLKEQLGDNYILQTYWLEEKIVGFISGIVNNDSLDAHFVGIDYSLNREYAIYQRMLYDYVTIAIKRQLKHINFGRTASEIKSSIGAVPQELTMYVRHKKSITNRILKLFLQKIEPTSFKQKFPFKEIKEVVKQS